MTSTTVAGAAGRAAPTHLHSVFADSLRLAFGTAHQVVGASLVWLASALPLIAAVVLGSGMLALLAVLPLLLVTTALFRGMASIAVGRAFRWRSLCDVDPLLAVVAWAGCVVVAWLAGAGVVGFAVLGAVGATASLVLPLAAAYGGVRDRRGFSALRGGAIVAIVRPDLALTAAALIVIGLFAIVASAGALALCVPAFVALFASRAVFTEIARLEDAASTRQDES